MPEHALVGTLVVAALAGVVIVALWGYPGYLSTGPMCPEHLTGPVGSTSQARSYCAVRVSLVSWAPSPSPYAPWPGPPPSEAGLLGFEFHLTMITEQGYFYLRGNVTEPNGTAYFFDVLGDNASGTPFANWSSPDSLTTIQWAAPYATPGTNGAWYTNVTCGVYPAAEFSSPRFT